MYSKNDYRYYLEHRLAESNDHLAHYGVKGMKWHKRRTLQAIQDVGQLTGYKGFLSYVDAEKKTKEASSKRAKKLLMDKVGESAKKSAEKTKMIRKKEPQIKAASRLLAAEAAYTAESTIKGITRRKRKKRRY